MKTLAAALLILGALGGCGVPSDDASAVDDELRGKCNDPGEQCCKKKNTGKHFCRARTACNQATLACEHCGGPGEPCCDHLLPNGRYCAGKNRCNKATHTCGGKSSGSTPPGGNPPGAGGNPPGGTNPPSSGPPDMSVPMPGSNAPDGGGPATPCGLTGLACCTSGADCRDGSVCASDQYFLKDPTKGPTCMHCGGPSEPCCPGNTCNGTTNIYCDTEAPASCETCGNADEYDPCCPGDPNSCYSPTIGHAFCFNDPDFGPTCNSCGTSDADACCPTPKFAKKCFEAGTTCNVDPTDGSSSCDTP
jgi:hypothetical protein